MGIGALVGSLDGSGGCEAGDGAAFVDDAEKSSYSYIVTAVTHSVGHGIAGDFVAAAVEFAAVIAFFTVKIDADGRPACGRFIFPQVDVGGELRVRRGGDIAAVDGVAEPDKLRRRADLIDVVA